MSISKITILCTALLLPNIIFAECIVTGKNFSKSSNIIYVNPNNGSDQLAQIYSLDRVRNPYEANNVAAFQSIEKAKSLADSSNGDLILIRAGGHWTSFEAWEDNSLSDFNKAVLKAKGMSQRECIGESNAWVPPAVNDNQPAPSPVKSDFISDTENVTLTRAEETAPIRLPGITSANTTDAPSTNTTSSLSGGSRSSGGGPTGGRSSSDSSTAQPSSSQSLLSDSPSSTASRNKTSNRLLTTADNITEISDSDQSISNDSASENIIENIDNVTEGLGLLSCEVNAPWQYAIQKYPQDSNGWSIITPDKETRIVYVSSTQGDDSSGKPYLSSELSEPFNPSDVQAYKTIGAAIKNLREGKPDWILLKRGENFETESELRLPSGLSMSHHTIMASYGESNQRPVIDTQDHSGVVLFGKNYITIMGLDFYPSKLDPRSPSFVGWNKINSTVDGIKILSFGKNLDGYHIENNRLQYYNMNIVVSGKGIKNNVVIRRNQILNSYSDHSHSQGLYANLINNFLIEENIFDHNGWLKVRSEGQELNDKTKGTATFYNHNAYLGNSSNMVIRKNLFSRASSMGLKLVSNPSNENKQNSIMAYNYLIQNNLFVEGEIGISAGGNTDFDNGYRWDDIYITSNVMTNIGKSNPTGRGLAWYIGVQDWASGEICGNYLTDQNQTEIHNVRGLNFTGDLGEVVVRNNNILNMDLQTQTFEVNDLFKFVNNTFIDGLDNTNYLQDWINLNNFHDYDSYIKSKLDVLNSSAGEYFKTDEVNSFLKNQSENSKVQYFKLN